MHPGHHCIADRNRIRSSRLRRKSTVRRWCRFSGSPAQPIQSSASGSGLGCSVSDTSDVSFGPGEAPSSDGVTCSHAYLLLPPTGFAAAGGGVWAMQWTSAGIFIWRFTRSSIPSDISSGTPDSSKWGTPFAAWPASTCSPTKYFADMNLVFDITVSRLPYVNTGSFTHRLLFAALWRLGWRPVRLERKRSPEQVQDLPRRRWHRISLRRGLLRSQLR